MGTFLLSLSFSVNALRVYSDIGTSRLGSKVLLLVEFCYSRVHRSKISQPRTWGSARVLQDYWVAWEVVQLKLISLCEFPLSLPPLLVRRAQL